MLRKKIVKVSERYEVHLSSTLGEGGFGSVFRGQDVTESPPLDCAVKRVSMASESEKKVYMNEIQVLRKVSDHKSIVSLLDNVESPETGWMFLEMATGGELFDRLIDCGALSEANAWPYMTNLVDAIAYCHKIGVVHRDLKLENVMLCAESPVEIRLIDFGLATQLQLDDDGNVVEGQLLSDTAGTQAYRAPEVTNSEGYSPFKVDVWALGIVLFSLCAGFFPMQEAKEDDWRFKRLKEDQEKGMGTCEAIFKTYKRECPFAKPLIELIDGMLWIDFERRFSLADVQNSEWMRNDPRPYDENGNLYQDIVYRSCAMDCEPAIDIPADAIKITRQNAALK